MTVCKRLSALLSAMSNPFIKSHLLIHCCNWLILAFINTLKKYI